MAKGVSTGNDRIALGESSPKVFQDLDAVREFPLDDSDLLISGYPKSGTNWMQVILASLWDGWGTCAITERGQVPNLSGPNGVPNYAGYDYCIAAESPRLMKTHLRRDLMPARWPEHGKVVHIVRNPKDVCVSHFYEARNSSGLDITFDEYFDRFMAGEAVPYGCYLDNVLSWRTFEHPNLLKITYEDARLDTRTVIEEIVGFVGKDVTAERIDEVITKTEFDAMRKNPELTKQINHPNYADTTEMPFLRKGIVGDWKSSLTVEQSERIDREVVAVLEREGVFLTYE